MLQDFLKEAMSIAIGKQSEQISDYMDSKKYINEFLIAKKLDMTINQTRNILYRLSDSGLVSYIRKKDKRKGWYTYFWRVEPIRALEFLKNVVLKRIEQINNQIKSRETKVFYVCERCSIEYSEESALYHDFTCVECGNLLTIMDNSKLLRGLRKELEKMEEKLADVNDEIEKERGKVEKVRAREEKKKKKRKKVTRAVKEKSMKRRAKKKTAKKKPKKKRLVKKKKSGKRISKRKKGGKKAVKKSRIKGKVKRSSKKK